MYCRKSYLRSSENKTTEDGETENVDDRSNSALSTVDRMYDRI